MKKQALFLAAVLWAGLSHCQTPQILNLPTGVGTSFPFGSMHIHDTRFHEPELPPSPDGLRDDPYGFYITDLHLTNTWTGSNANDGFSIFQYNNSVTLQQRESDDLNIFAHNGKGITINASGLIGMGTSPTNAYRLNINGGTHIGGLLLVDAGITANNLNASEALTAGSAVIGNGFSCSSTGLVRAKEIRVSLNGWSDFVFNKDYSLLSLPELEAYINNHHHLPDIPSAEEATQDGIDIATMNALLLQKIEELTLYIIDLQKQIDQLKNQQK